MKLVSEQSSNEQLSSKTLIISTLLVFLTKLLMAYGFCQMVVANHPENKLGKISYASGDHNSYVGAMENYKKTGSYFFIQMNGDTVRAGRSPHFGMPYFVARTFFSPETSCDVLSLVSILLDSFAILCVAILAFSFANRKYLAFFLALLLGAASTYVSHWSINTVPDSPAASLIMIGIYFFWKVNIQDEKIKRHLFLLSFFFSWAIALRPYLSIIVAIFAIAFLFQMRKRKKMTVLPKYIIICSIPLLCFVAPWATRNYSIFGKFLPFQQDMYAGYGYLPSEIKIRKLMKIMGEDGTTYWDPKAMISYFKSKTHSTSEYTYPGYLKRDTIFLLKLEQVRKDFISDLIKGGSQEDLLLMSRIDSLEKEYKKKHSIHVFFLSPMKRVVKFWGHSGSYYLPQTDKGGIFKLILFANKLFQSALYLLVLFVGAYYLWRVRRQNKFAPVLLIPVIGITFIMPIVFGLLEPRYSLSFYYPCLVGLILFVVSIQEKIFKRKFLNSSKEIFF